ncbi:Hypothetical protein, putative [Bodo saltans]|uniref:Membrane-associated protein n=1 Tax=Bodo saltans TaxID=75058 RepID=A0A0S4J7F6_BODSA|nr:Hypothetical protein, putative [Bodo saltans]|eukprot:CUG87400.1 Hypothetical protein, putative [Bodo saltans]
MNVPCFTVLVATVLLFVCSGSDNTNPTAERAALISFYEATNGAGWILNNATVPANDSCTGTGTNLWDVLNPTSKYCCWFWHILPLH